MKRLQAILLGLFLLLLAVPSLAQSQVDSVRIDVELQDDGSAIIHERWVIDVAGDITEWYLGKENLGRMEIRDFSVTDGNMSPKVPTGTSTVAARARPKGAE